MSTVRPPAVAGQFYPGQAAELQQAVDAYLQEASSDVPCPKAVIAPHAGYIYSGSIAAKAYAQVANGVDRISRVILMGPAHRVGFRGMALSGADFYATPLGQVPIDKAAIDSIRSLPAVGNLDQAHAEEHSLEVHLPFLQRCLKAFTLVPIVVGQCAPGDVARVLNTLWGGEETLIVISSDLSHFLNYEQAIEKDRNTSDLIVSRSSELTGEQTCGCQPLNGFMQVLREKDLEVSELGLLNSGDTAGDPERVVGYGAYAVSDQVITQQLGLAERQQLLYIARKAIVERLNGNDKFDLAVNQFSAVLQNPGASFVTLKIAGRLRGCIGSLQAQRPMLLDVAHNAMSAAFKDHRFKPLSSAEYAAVDVHISVLSAPVETPVSSRAELIALLQPGVHGLILEDGNHRSTYLPSVWEQLPYPEQFISELRAKAGLPREGWSDTIKVSLYTSEEFA